jgi:serine/threonine protein kinase
MCVNVQLSLINALTSPSPEDVASIDSPYGDVMMQSVNGETPYHGQHHSLEEACPDASASAISLLRGLLQFSPSKRLTVDEALAHPYFGLGYPPSQCACVRACVIVLTHARRT